MAKARRRHLGPWKERQVRARVPFGVGVEEVIRAWIVLIHRLLDEAHSQHACVKVEILLSWSGNGRDVVKAVYGFHIAMIASTQYRRRHGPCHRLQRHRFVQSLSGVGRMRGRPPIGIR